MHARQDEVERTSALDRAAALIAEADGLLIAAGAGMGVDSGLPDFRGTDGFWRAYPALAAARLPFEQIASPASFHDDPALAWGFYGHRLALYRATRPHAGFAHLLQSAARMPAGAFVFTSNVDGQFQKAGFAHDAVAEVHGSLHILQCLAPCSDALWPAASLKPQVDEATCRLVSAMPTCPRCGGVARPNVLMFSDAGWISDRSDAQARQLRQWLQEAGRVVVIELGAGSEIATVRRFVEGLRRPYVRINPREWAVRGEQGVGIAGGALEVLAQLNGRLP